MIKNKDPKIYTEDANFYHEDGMRTHTILHYVKENNFFLWSKFTLVDNILNSVILQLLLPIAHPEALAISNVSPPFSVLS